MIELVLALFLAHGDAAWIQGNPAYVDKANIHCCGIKDCDKEPAKNVKWTAEGWLVLDTGQLFREGEKGLYPSVDSDFWACRPVRGHVSCLFTPTAGS